MMWQCDEIVTFIPSSRENVTFKRDICLEVLKNTFPKPGSVTSSPKPGLGSGNISARNDPEQRWTSSKQGQKDQTFWQSWSFIHDLLGMHVKGSQRSKKKAARRGDSVSVRFVSGLKGLESEN